MTAAQISHADALLFLVRLRGSFRFRESEPRDIIIHLPMVQGAFQNYDAAKTYVRQCPPISSNPFAIDDTNINFSVHEGVICFHHFDDVDEGYDDKATQDADNPPSDTETPIKDLVTLCQQIGATPPDLGREWNAKILDFADRQKGYEWHTEICQRLRQWWEDQKDSMTSEQKGAIWRKLHPRPYEIVPVPLERVAQ